MKTVPDRGGGQMSGGGQMHMLLVRQHPWLNDQLAQRVDSPHAGDTGSLTGRYQFSDV